MELNWFLLRNKTTNALEPECLSWPTIIFKSKIQPSIFALSSIFYINKNFTSNGTRIKDSNLRIIDSFETGGVQNFTLAYFIEILPNYKISKTDFSFEWPSSQLQRELIAYYKLLYVSASTTIVRWYITRNSLKWIVINWPALWKHGSSSCQRFTSRPYKVWPAPHIRPASERPAKPHNSYTVTRQLSYTVTRQLKHLWWWDGMISVFLVIRNNCNTCKVLVWLRINGSQLSRHVAGREVKL
jgi:hypothetical protein